jgi:hypothetical protein
VDQEIRSLQRNGDPSWRFKAQRVGLPIPLQVGDVITIGPSYNFKGGLYSDKWCGLPCPVTVIVTAVEEWKTPQATKKIVASLPPPYVYMPSAVADNRIKELRNG